MGVRYGKVHRNRPLTKNNLWKGFSTIYSYYTVIKGQIFHESEADELKHTRKNEDSRSVNPRFFLKFY